MLLCSLPLICAGHFQRFLFSGVAWGQMFVCRRMLMMNAEDRRAWWVLGGTAHIAGRKDELPCLLGVLSGEILPLSAPAGIASAAESLLAQGHRLLEAAHPMAAQDQGTKACIPWGSLGSLCFLPHVSIPKVFLTSSPNTTPLMIVLNLFTLCKGNMCFFWVSHSHPVRTRSCPPSFQGRRLSTGPRGPTLPSPWGQGVCILLCVLRGPQLTGSLRSVSLAKLCLHHDHVLQKRHFLKVPCAPLVILLPTHLLKNNIYSY